MLVAKTALHELAYGAPHPSFPATRNPHGRGRAPGGSSSGSAVAVAAGHVVLALGTDTGGSVRQPAAYCGVVGVKPSPGLVSLRGAVPLAPSLDTVGFFARDLADALVILAVLCPGLPARRPRGARIGIVAPQAGTPASEATWRAVRRAAARLGAAGHPVDELRLPDLAALHLHHSALLRSEAIAIHGAQIAGHPRLYGPYLRAALLGSPPPSAAALREARRARREARTIVDTLLTRVRALVLPVVPDVAPRLDPASGRAAGRDLTRWTFFASFLGLPALSVPAGTHDGLPLAVQLVGRRGDDAALLALAREVVS